MTESFWTFAVEVNGELHVWQGIDMPPAINVVRVPVRIDRDLVRIVADDLAALRQLIGEKTREIFVSSGPDAASELKDLLTRINEIAQARIDVLRGDAEEDDPPAPGMR